MKTSKWLFVFLPVILFFGCFSWQQSELKLTIDSEPSNAKIYDEGKFLGNAPVVLSYKFKYGVNTTLGEPQLTVFPSEMAQVRSILRPKSFTASKDGYESQTRSFQFSSPIPDMIETGPRIYFRNTKQIFDQPDASLLLILEPEKAKPQQQQQQQQQTVIVMPSAVAAKIYGTLTIISTPDQAEI